MFKDLDQVEEFVKELQSQYENTPGIISIRLDEFIGDSIVIAIDNELLAVTLPEQYKDVRVIVFDVYQNYKLLSDVIDDLVVNEPGLWDHGATLEALVKTCESYKRIINDYEKRKYDGRRSN